MAYFFGLGDREVAGHGHSARAVDRHRVDPDVGIAARHLHAFRVERHLGELLLLSRPERVEVRGLGHALAERVDVGPGAAVEKEASLLALEFLQGVPALWRRGVAGELLGFLLERLAGRVDDHGVEAHEPRLRDAGLVHERLAREGLASVLRDAVVAAAHPLEEIRACGNLARDLLRLNGEDHGFARFVGDRGLVRGSLQPRVVKRARAREIGQRRDCDENDHTDFFHVLFLSCRWRSVSSG